MPLINNISNAFPSSPLLTQPYDTDPGLLCHDTAPVRACIGVDNYCSCIHVLKLKLDSVVEIVLIDEGIHYVVYFYSLYIHVLYSFQ